MLCQARGCQCLLLACHALPGCLLRLLIHRTLLHQALLWVTVPLYSAVDAVGDVTAMRDRLLWAMDKLEVKHAERQEWLAHLHFARLPLSGLSDVGANFIPYLVCCCSLASTRAQISVSLQAASQPI